MIFIYDCFSLLVPFFNYLSSSSSCLNTKYSFSSAKLLNMNFVIFVSYEVFVPLLLNLSFGDSEITSVLTDMTSS